MLGLTVRRPFVPRKKDVWSTPSIKVVFVLNSLLSPQDAPPDPAP